MTERTSYNVLIFIRPSFDQLSSAILGLIELLGEQLNRVVQLDGWTHWRMNGRTDEQQQELGILVGRCSDLALTSWALQSSASMSFLVRSSIESFSSTTSLTSFPCGSSSHAWQMQSFSTVQFVFTFDTRLMRVIIVACLTNEILALSSQDSQLRN